VRLGETDGGFVGELPEAREVLDPAHLLGGLLGQLRAPVTDLGQPQAAGGIEVLATSCVGQPTALPRDHHHPITDVVPEEGMEDEPAVGERELAVKRIDIGDRRHPMTT